MVKASSNNDSTTINIGNETHTETVFCAFKQDGTFDASLVEKRIPPLKPEVVSSPPSVQLKLVSNENVINFRSQLKTSMDTTSKVGKIIFYLIIANVGEGFNGKTGIFVAPKPGVYKFIFKGTLVDRQPFTKIIYLYLNDQKVGNARNVQGGDGKELFLIEETMKLNRGDKVYLVLGPSFNIALDGGIWQAV